MAMANGTTSTVTIAVNWRTGAAVGLWVVGFFPPFLIPLVAASSMSPVTKAVLVAMLVMGFPQLLTAIAVALVGRRQLLKLVMSVIGAAGRWWVRLESVEVWRGAAAREGTLT
jgi:hypothetical protein